ncbi:Na+/H+ antiporter NhaA [Schlesneria sp. DSM 10557]|uniref:Na+/H+ antiporter NhaA n=1 Tax=Schlesneria sp. DSM 10557 TaxID=3044399 RepID=UPI00359FED88
MTPAAVRQLDPPVDPLHDHILGPPDAEMTLVQYGSYADYRCRAVHVVVEALRNRFGDRMRYVFRHLPVEGKPDAQRAAEVAERVFDTTGNFWDLHESFMERGPTLNNAGIEEAAREYGVTDDALAGTPRAEAARLAVQEDVDSAHRSGVIETPAFFINGRRYTDTWDESSLADAMLAPLGHRIQAAAFNFVHWGPSSGLLLGLATLLAIVLSNSPLSSAFEALWQKQLGFIWGSMKFSHSLLHWVNHGLLTVFFFVVGLEIKREFTVGHLATFRSGALPVIAAIGGIALPAIIYASIVPADLRQGWGIPIGTDTAFAVALIVLLGSRVPIALRVFLTAAVIIDDVVAILIIAFFYTESINTLYLIAGGAVTAVVVALNRIGVYRSLPYAVCAVALWFVLHEAGLHATLAAVIMAILIPARPPANLKALLTQASAVINREESHAGEAMRNGPSEGTLRTLDAIYNRMESPNDRLLRSVEPWSSYVALPIFALANAGVTWTPGVLEGRGRLIAAIALGLIIGKPVGIITASWLAVRSGIADKPDAYTWRQLCGAGALGGIGFTMSLFIAGIAFPDQATYAAAKIAIFVASLIAGAIGFLILWPKSATAE